MREDAVVQDAGGVKYASKRLPRLIRQCDGGTNVLLDRDVTVVQDDFHAPPSEPRDALIAFACGRPPSHEHESTSPAMRQELCSHHSEAARAPHHQERG